jgi:hypothetical protein
MGQCYEKLGGAEARKTYERVMPEFADQKEAVAGPSGREGHADRDRHRRAADLGIEVYGL